MIRGLLLIFISLFFLLDAYISDELIQHGSVCNSFLMYEEAINSLTEAIELDPTIKEAYQERAISYFEVGNLQLAFQDYLKAKKQSLPPFQFNACRIKIPKFMNDSASLDFATGLLLGIWAGGRQETVEFLSSLRGSLSFFWAFMCTPREVSEELVDALYVLGHFLSNATMPEILDEMIPEIMECKEYWHIWPDQVKGEKMGFILGKYGIGIFLYVTTNKGYYVFNKVKRANMMCILEKCTLHNGNHIIEESAKQASKNVVLLKKSISGSIVVHNPNVAYHILQKKHRWDRFIKMTGNPQEDFKKVVQFLEKHQILKETPELDYRCKAISTYAYSKKIENETIVALFQVTNNKQFFLRNAWVAESR